MIGQNRPVFQLNLLKGGQYNYFWEKGKFLSEGSAKGNCNLIFY